MDRIEKFYRENFKRLTGFIKEYTDGSYEIASDIVQMVFVRLLEMEREGRTNFYEEDSLNFFYVYRASINTALKYQRAKKKINKVSLEDVDLEMEDYPESKDAMERMILKMDEELKELHWYDEKMIRIHMEGTSMNQIHRDTDIGLTSIKNTIKNGKARIYEGLREDWEDFSNGDYDQI
jgi:RNA polymerase sigma factor (sigma-70 family)